MSTDGYQSPTGIPADRQSERRLNDLGVTLDKSGDGNVLTQYHDPADGITIVAFADSQAGVGAAHEAFSAVCQQTILELGFRQEVDR